MNNNNQLPSIEPYTVEELPDISQDQAFPENSEGGGFNSFDSFDEPPKSSKRKFPIFLIVMAVAVIGLLIFGFLLLGSLGGGDDNGNGNNGGTTNPPETGGSTTRTLIWRGAFIDREILQPLLDEYEEQTGITVEYANIWNSSENVSFTESAESYQTLLNSQLANTSEAPDIFTIPGTWMGQYENVVIPAPASTYSFAQFTENFFDSALIDFAGSGIVYGLPLWTDTYAILYNEDILSSFQLSEPSANFFPFQDIAEEMTSVAGNTVEQAGFAAGDVNNVDFFYEMLLIFIQRNGVDLTDANRQVSFATADAVEAIEIFFSFTSNDTRTWDDAFQNDSIAFLEEEVAMIFAPSWRLREILRFNEGFGLNLNIGVSPIPTLPNQEEPTNWADTWGLVVSRERSQNAELSWQFISWITEPEQQRKIHENIENSPNYGHFGHLYPRRDLQNELGSQLDEDDYLSVYNEALPFAKSWYIINGREVRELFKEVLGGSAGISESTLTGLQEDILELQTQGIQQLN